MAQINIQKRQLIHWARELEALRGSILEVFFSSKIKEFINVNGLRINSVRSGQLEITKKYYEFEGEQPKVVDEKLVLLADKTEEEAAKEMNEYLDTAIAVTI